MERRWGRGRRAWSVVVTLGAGALLVALAGCGGASVGAGAATTNRSVVAPGSAPGGSAGAPNGATGDQTSAPTSVAQYLIKSLSVSMTAPDTRQTAAALTSWILTADPKATSAGMNYSQDGASYDVSMTFTVEASVYPKIEAYLAGYAQGHGGKLVSLQESVQDVTNDYVDSQSRLSNLRGEQQRLQTLMSQAQSLSDVLDIEQRLTDVEGQIESIEAHLAQLSGQTTFYTVQIELTPLDVAVAPPQPWSPSQVFGQAWAAAIVFGQTLGTLFIWLLVFCVYIAPALAIAFGIRWLVVRRARRASAAVASSAPHP